MNQGDRPWNSASWKSTTGWDGMKARALLLLMALVLFPLYALARPGGGQSYHAAPSHSASSSSHSYSTAVALGVGWRRRLDVAGRGGDAVRHLRHHRRHRPGDQEAWRRSRAEATVHRSTAAGAGGAARARIPASTRQPSPSAPRASWPRSTRRGSPARWARRDAHISDGVYVRFQTQLQLLKTQGLRNAMADWSVVGCDVLAAESDAKWDTVHVNMVGQARDADVPASAGAQQAMEKAKYASLERYEEVWSFLRKRGSKSKNGVPALEGLPQLRRRFRRSATWCAANSARRSSTRASTIGCSRRSRSPRVAPMDDQRRDPRAPRLRLPDSSLAARRARRSRRWSSMGATLRAA